MDKISAKIIPTIILLMACVLVCLNLSNQSLALFGMSVFLWIACYGISEDKIDKKCAELIDRINALDRSVCAVDLRERQTHEVIGSMNTSIEQFKHALGEVKRIDACIQELDKSGVEHAKEIATLKNAINMKQLGR